MQVVNEVSDTSDISAGTKYRYELMDESDVNCQSRCWKDILYDCMHIQQGHCMHPIPIPNPLGKCLLKDNMTVSSSCCVPVKDNKDEFREIVSN